MKVFIIPSDDRQIQLEIIDRHTRLGNDVYSLQFNAIDYFDWSRIAMWPYMTALSSNDKRNIDVFDYGMHNLKFGEDAFLFLEQKIDHLSKHRCTLITYEEFMSTSFDVLHLPRSTFEYQNKMLTDYQTLYPDVKVITSQMSACWHPQSIMWNDCKNALYPIPSWFQTRTFLNGCMLAPTPIQFEAVGESLEVVNAVDRDGIASFNHNFAIRQPNDFQFFKAANQLGANLTNYGGNIRRAGADIRYSKSGPTGTFETLSVKNAVVKTKHLRAVAPFKETDWGGGTVWYALLACTPIIMRKSYYNITGAKQFFVDGKHCIIVESAQDVVDASIALKSDERLQPMINAMQQLRDSLITESNNEFSTFLQRLV